MRSRHVAGCVLAVALSFGLRAEGRMVALGPAVKVNTEQVKSDRGPKLAPLADGGFVVFWNPGDSAGLAWARRFDANGNPVGAPFELANVPAMPIVAATATGFATLTVGFTNHILRSFTADGVEIANLVLIDRCCSVDLVWTRWEELLFAWGDSTVTFAQPFSSGLEPITDPLPITPTVGYTFAVNFDWDGNTLVASWTGRAIQAERVGPDGIPLGAPVLVADLVTEVDKPFICADDEGNFAIAWGGSPRLREFRRYNAKGEPTSGRQALGLTTFSFACLPDGDVVATGGGTFWGPTGLTEGTAIRAFDAGSGMIGQVLLATSYHVGSAVSALADGSVAVAWQDCVRGDCEVHVQRFSLSAERVPRGDCNMDGRVTIDEVMAAITFALSARDSDCLNIEFCLAVDSSLDCAISVDEIIGAVDAALGTEAL